jgi:hypothetical protein
MAGIIILNLQLPVSFAVPNYLCQDRQYLVSCSKFDDLWCCPTDGRQNVVVLPAKPFAED